MTGPLLDIGLVVGPFHGRIDADAAQAYALATNDPNRAYFESDAVPPLYTVALILPALQEGLGLGAPIAAIPGAHGGVHGEHDVLFHQRVRQGMALRWTSETYAATQTGAGVMVTQRLVLTDEDDAPVVEHLWSSLYLGGTLAGEYGAEQLGPVLRDHTFPEDARARPVGSHTFEVTGDQSFRYAGASTDHAPIHVDDEAARRAGFPSKFLQGVCTFAMCSGAVVKVAADGDPARIRRLACRFAAPVFPRSTLVVNVFDTGTTDRDGVRSVAFDAASGDTTVIKHGRAEIVT